jgi:hypothetical protein
MDGLSVAQTEFDRELGARRDAEAEVTRLRVLLSGQAARLTTLSGEHLQQELRQKMSKDLSDNLDRLEKDISKLSVERDMTLAEVQELSSSKRYVNTHSENFTCPYAHSGSSTSNTSDIPGLQFGRSLTMRLDNIKAQYKTELLPLTQQREALSREISELKIVRDVFLEETTALNARNEELAQLSAMYTRKMEASAPSVPVTPKREPPISEKGALDKFRQQQQSPIPHSISNASSNASDDADHKSPRVNGPEVLFTPPSKKFIKWPGSKTKDAAMTGEGGRLGHMFQQVSILRFTRCDHCGDKMWGSQLRCSSGCLDQFSYESISNYLEACHISVHVRCINHVNVSCSHRTSNARDDPLREFLGSNITVRSFMHDTCSTIYVWP